MSYIPNVTPGSSGTGRKRSTTYTAPTEESLMDHNNSFSASLSGGSASSERKKCTNKKCNSHDGDNGDRAGSGGARTHTHGNNNNSNSTANAADADGDGDGDGEEVFSDYDQEFVDSAQNNYQTYYFNDSFDEYDAETAPLLRRSGGGSSGIAGISGGGASTHSHDHGLSHGHGGGGSSSQQGGHKHNASCKHNYGAAPAPGITSSSRVASGIIMADERV